ncbi:MAG: helix-turn-helix transcriptional regulator [Actinomycetales bacterium]|nr:helix-turn-helix transcriptional regulator [Candidatus Phosphoribacter baldrii]
MQVRTVRDLGAMVRTTRRAHGLTQADLADRLRVSRDWVVRLEQGSPRLETQKVLDALGVLGLTLEVANAQPTRTTTTATTTATATATAKPAAKTRARSATTGQFVTQRSAARKSTDTAGTTGLRTSAAVTTSDPFGFLNDRTS